MNTLIKPYVESGNEDHLQLLKNIFSEESQDQSKASMDLSLPQPAEHPQHSFAIESLFNQDLDSACGCTGPTISLLTKINSTEAKLSGSQSFGNELSCQQTSNLFSLEEDFPSNFGLTRDEDIISPQMVQDSLDGIGCNYSVTSYGGSTESQRTQEEASDLGNLKVFPH